MVAVKAGDRIALQYVALGPAGELLATNAGGAALVMQAAGDDVIAGLSVGVIGMQVGEERIFHFSPTEAFGLDSGAVERFIEANRLPEGVEVGDVVRIAMAGMSAMVWVVAREETGFRVRTQHPMAGQSIDVKVRLVAIEGT